MQQLAIQLTNTTPRDIQQMLEDGKYYERKIKTPEFTLEELQTANILQKIEELDKSNLSIIEMDALLFPYLIKIMPQPVQDAYDKMITRAIPF